MKNVYKIFVVVAIAGFLFVLLPVRTSFAGQCSARINFQVQPNPVSENGIMVLSGYVDMSGSAWEGPGTPNAGYCYVGSTLIKAIVVNFTFIASTGTDVKEEAVPTIALEPNRTVKYGFSENFKAAAGSAIFKAGKSFNVTAKVFNENLRLQLTASTPVTVQVTTSVFGNYYCVGPDVQGQEVYICDDRNDKNCVNTSSCKDKSQCKTLDDKSLCGKPISTQTHKACISGKCIDVAGAGNDNCTACGGTKIYACKAGNGKYACSDKNKKDLSDVTAIGGDCDYDYTDPSNVAQQVDPSWCGKTDQEISAGGGGTTTTKYTFNLLNPIGVENFQDLVNIIGKWIFNLAIPIAVIVIIWAGVLMLTAGGVPARFQKGAKALWYAVLGLAVVLIGKGFVTLVQSILSLKNK